MRRAVLCVAVLWWAAGLSSAAESVKPDGLQLKDLAWIIGEWQGEYILPEGFPELGPAGSKVVRNELWQWTLAREFIVLRSRDEIDGKVSSTGHELVGFDDATGKLAHWLFGSTGGHGTGVWSREGDRWMLKWEAAAPGGKKFAGTSDQILIDADTYTWQMRDLTENGKKIPDWPKVTLKRKKPSPGGVTADDYVEFHKPLLGSWKATIEVGEQVNHGTATWQLAENKKCFMVNLQVDGYPALQAMMGYDPVSGKFTQTTFDSEGSYQVATLDIAGMKKGKKMSEGFIGKWEEKRFQADGTVVTATETLSCTEMGERRLVFVWSNRRERGKTLPDWKLTYERP